MTLSLLELPAASLLSPGSWKSDSGVVLPFRHIQPTKQFPECDHSRLHMESANPPATFYKAHDNALLCAALLTASRWLGFANARCFTLAVIGFIGFYDLARTAHWPRVASFFNHGLTYPVAHKPSRTVAPNAKSTHKLVSRYALFRRCHEIEAQSPFVERDMAAFHD